MASNEVNQVEHKYEIGDSVVWINDYGVNLGKRTITSKENFHGRPAYQIEPYDTPWCPVLEKNLHGIAVSCLTSEASAP
jgi:hypothetical protein